MLLYKLILYKHTVRAKISDHLRKESKFFVFCFLIEVRIFYVILLFLFNTVE